MNEGRPGPAPSAPVLTHDRETSPRLCLLLHAHLPFVRHPEHPRFLEEDWLFEAILEVYLPLLMRLERLAEDDVPTPVTLSLSTTLLAMLEDTLLRGRFLEWLERRIELLELEVSRTRWQPELHRLARRYEAEAVEARQVYLDRYAGDLVHAFGRLANGIELSTTNASHGFLPLLGDSPTLWRAQIGIARAEHARHFGRAPVTHWLSECGYVPGLDREMAAVGIRAFCVEEHGVAHARPAPRHGAHAPIRTGAGVLAFGRDSTVSREIWSAGEGLPSHPDYRDFYRDVGWDLDLEYLAPYLHDPERRNPLSIRYHRVTGAGEKALYDPERALAVAEQHAREFWLRRVEQAAARSAELGRPAVVTLPFDAELFGHWWYEGGHFLESLFRAAAGSSELRLVSLEEAASLERRVQQAEPASSSWGEGGYSGYWLSRENDWILKRLHPAGEQMIALATSAPERPRIEVERALRQAGRELLQAQCSDWPFILKAGASASYAGARAEEHLTAFSRLYDELARDQIDLRHLSEREARLPIYPALDWRLFASTKG